MMCQQAAIEKAHHLFDIGELKNVDEMNVEVVRMMGVREISGKQPRDYRNALNKAVKEGKLGHIKKDGLKPEVYFHPNAKGTALELRDRRAYSALQSIMKVCVPHSIYDEQ